MTTCDGSHVPCRACGRCPACTDDFASGVLTLAARVKELEHPLITVTSVSARGMCAMCGREQAGTVTGSDRFALAPHVQGDATCCAFLKKDVNAWRDQYLSEQKRAEAAERARDEKAAECERYREALQNVQYSSTIQQIAHIVNAALAEPEPK